MRNKPRAALRVGGLFSLPFGAPKELTLQAASHQHEDNHLQAGSAAEQAQAAWPRYFGVRMDPSDPIGLWEEQEVAEPSTGGLPRGPPWCEGRGPAEGVLGECLSQWLG